MQKEESGCWPDGPGFFRKTNVEALARGIPEGNEILGLPQEEKGISDVVNNPLVNTEK